MSYLQHRWQDERIYIVVISSYTKSITMYNKNSRLLMRSYDVFLVVFLVGPSN